MNRIVICIDNFFMFEKDLSKLFDDLNWLGKSKMYDVDINDYIDPGQKTKVCLLYIKEIINPGHYKRFETDLNLFASYCKSHDILCDDFEFITNYSFKPFQDFCTVPDTCQPIMIDNFRLVAYLSQKFNLFNNHPPLTNINDNNKYLCKFGKLHKPHRYVLYCLMRDLQLFHDDKGMWSLVTGIGPTGHLDPEIKKSFDDAVANLIRDYISTPPMYSLEDMLEHQRTLEDLDPSDTKFCAGGTFHYTGYPFDIEPYQNTKFSLVSESCWSINVKNSKKNVNDVMPTEKTWIPMSVKHPMLLSAAPEQAQVLKDLGFKSVDDFEFCNASKLLTYEKIKDLFVKCYEKFLDTPSSILFEIADHNHKLFEKLALRDYGRIPRGEGNCVWFQNINHPQSIIADEPNVINCILKNQYPNRGTYSYDWDWDAINKFSDDK